MSAWYKKNPNLFERERRALAQASPLMGLTIVGPEFAVNKFCILKSDAAVAYGTHQVVMPNSGGRKLEYKIALWTPHNFPKRPPVMFCNDPKLAWQENLDRHIYGLGQACLAVNAEVRLHWPPGSSLADFLIRLVEPWLIWQAYFDAHGEGPPWGERKHGREGIMEFYEDLWEKPLPPKFNLIAFIELLAMKKMPKGHHPCPCGSGYKLRNCHAQFVLEKWAELDQIDVIEDLSLVRR